MASFLLVLSKRIFLLLTIFIRHPILIYKLEKIGRKEYDKKARRRYGYLPSLED